MVDYIKLALAEFPQYFMNFLELAIGPKAFLARKSTLDAKATSKASIFGGISILLGFLLQIPLLPRQSNPVSEFSVMIASEVLLLLATVLVLRLAWKIVGGTATLSQLFVCTAYSIGPMLIFFIGFSLVGDVLFHVMDPETYAALRANPLAELPGSSTQNHGMAIANLANAIGLFCAFVWLAVAWGAYRAINRVSQFKSVVAYCLYVLFQIPLGAVALLLNLQHALAWGN